VHVGLTAKGAWVGGVSVGRGAVAVLYDPTTVCSHCLSPSVNTSPGWSGRGEVRDGRMALMLYDINLSVILLSCLTRKHMD